MKKAELLKNIKDSLTDVWPERSAAVIATHAKDILATLVGLGKADGVNENTVINYYTVLNIKNIVTQYANNR